MAVNDSLTYRIVGGDVNSVPAALHPSMTFSERSENARQTLEKQIGEQPDKSLVSCDPRCMSKDCLVFIQGEADIAQDGSAPLYARSLDAFACAARLFSDRGEAIQRRDDGFKSLTGTATSANPMELLREAERLLDLEEIDSKVKCYALRALISALKIEVMSSEETRSNFVAYAPGNKAVLQLHTLKVAKVFVQNPKFLKMGGPIIHSLTHIGGRILQHLQEVLAAGGGGGEDARMLTNSYLGLWEALSSNRRETHEFLHCHELPPLPVGEEAIMALADWDNGSCSSNTCLGGGEYAEDRTKKAVAEVNVMRFDICGLNVEEPDLWLFSLFE